MNIFNRNLTNEEVNELHSSVVQKFVEKFDIEIR